MQKFKITLYTLFLLACCSKTNGETDLQVSEDSQLSFFESNIHIKLKPNTANKVELIGPALLTSAGRLPLLVLPISSKNAVVKIDPPSLNSAIEKATEEELSNRLSKVLAEIADIQNLIRAKNLDAAKAKLDGVQVKNPNVKFLNFLRASILFLQGKKQQARALTEESLLLFPDYKEGKDFLKQLKGGG